MSDTPIDARELLRQHVMDYGFCLTEGCECSHARAVRWLEENEDRPSDEYYEGVMDGIRAHAIYRDGMLVVGALQKPIYRVLDEVRGAKALGQKWVF